MRRSGDPAMWLLLLLLLLLLVVARMLRREHEKGKATTEDATKFSPTPTTAVYPPIVARKSLNYSLQHVSEKTG